jgi:hypothetical protein
MTSHRRALTLGLAATAVAAAIVPAAAATKAPAPLTVYPSTASCPTGQGAAVYAIDTAAGSDKNDCAAFQAGVNAGKPTVAADADYIGTPRTHVKLGKSGAISGVIAVKAIEPVLFSKAAGYADVTVTLTINGREVGSASKSGPINPTADLSVPINFAIPAALRGKKVMSMDLLVHWNTNSGLAMVDQGASKFRLPRS